MQSGHRQVAIIEKYLVRTNDLAKKEVKEGNYCMEKSKENWLFHQNEVMHCMDKIFFLFAVTSIHQSVRQTLSAPNQLSPSKKWHVRVS